MKTKRVVLDTNLWISFLISKNYTELDDLIESNKVKLLFSSELIKEFLEVATRKKFEKYFKKKDITRLLEQLNNFGELIEIKSNISVCRDEKDDFLLNLSIDGNADYLITGDSDLLVLEKISKTKIISWADFIKKNKLI
ncbi:putative toxin-antitoxin system toxin component, PIN family [Marivirga tractuosa]|uniref:putative toxin-antitoxin system toxin component, PIN family n=1 Tax=Marivirga tractuosa TaxID=1006 RepID=UPI0035D11490